MTGLSSNAYTNLTLNNSLLQQFYNSILFYNSTTQHPSNSIIIQLNNSVTLLTQQLNNSTTLLTQQLTKYDEKLPL